MCNVYEIIDEIREARHLSLRKLAMLAGMAPTTFVSMMTRRPDNISVSTLTKIALVFGVRWYELLSANPLSEFHKFAPYDHDTARISSKVSDQEKSVIIRNVLSRPTRPDLLTESNYPVEDVGHPVKQGKQRDESSILSDENVIFRQSINSILRRLNTQGLMEAMRHLLDIANDPNYIIIKEDTLCQEDEPPAAQDYNPENVPMDDGKPASKRE